jgi:hypothetical protein
VGRWSFLPIPCANVRSTIIRKLTVLKLMWIGVVAARLYAADPRLGTWKLVSADSALDPPRELSVTSHGKGVHVVISGGSHVDFTAAWDGRDNPVQNIPAFNQIAIRRIDKNQVEISEKKNGMLVATLRDRISNDHKELTITTVQPRREDQVTVWKRSGAVQDAAKPFLGEWIQDFSKTRLRQGLVLRIEPDGKDGVHFVGEFSYTATFDGRDYALRDSRDDTVAIALIDTRTVDSTYKRGDQIADRDRWVVSTDGQLMTLTTTGVLGTGERIRENLVFRKQ